ncbi:MAG: plasmid pRiA4b ORF-3 family protein, partial [Bacteroidales bacterium]|nr:plasmid pRiA4b ORF-3 family protein [Bacteroidales bacterium]
DFGDNWEHEIEIIDILNREKIQYPKCIAGKRNSPPEDCGGIPGYEDIIEELKSKNKSEHQDILKWLGDYDLEKFDINEVNEAILNPDEYLFDFRDL